MRTSGVASGVFAAWGLAIARGECPTLPTEERTVYMPGHNVNVTIPALPDDTASYSYAAENALVAIPAACVSEFAGDISNAADLLNKNDCDPQGMKYLRIQDLSGGYSKLKEMKDCAEGLVLGFHGSGGPGWGAVQYAAITSGVGFVHIIPDSMAMPDSMGLKGKLPVKAGNEITTTDYCGSYSSATGKCSKFNKPFCYSTKFDNIISDSTQYRMYVEGVYQIRKRENDYFVENNQDLLSAFSKVYAIGNSEGAMILNRYYHADLHKFLSGMIFDGWSCEYNYFLPCADAAKICGDECDKSIPLLNLIGAGDEYFGRVETSMAARVAAHDDGYGAATITGNCHATFTSQSFTDTTTVVFGDTEHTPKYWNDNVVRAATLDFMGKGTTSWKDGCTEVSDVWECPLTGAATCMPGWTRNADEVNTCASETEEPVQEWEVRKLGLSGGTAVITMALAGAFAVGLVSLGALMGKRVRGGGEKPLASLAVE